MTTNYFTAIATGAAANALTFNTPLGALDAQITTNAAAIAANALLAAATTAEVVAARGSSPNLDARLDALVLAGGNVATKANGVSAAGQKVLTVDATTGFIVGAYVTYLLNGATLEGNTIGSIQAGVSLTLGTNIGTGGVLDDTYISMISTSEYLAAQAIPHAGTLMLPDTMAIVNSGVFNVDAHTDIQAAITAAQVQSAATGTKSIVRFATDEYTIDTMLTISGPLIHVDLNGATLKATSALTALISITADDVSISNGTLYATTATKGVYINGGSGTERNRVVLDNVYIEGCTLMGVRAVYANDLVMRNVRAKTVGYDEPDGVGVFGFFSCNRVTISDCSALDGFTKGFAFQTCTDVAITNCRATNIQPGSQNPVQGTGFWIGYDSDTVSMSNCQASTVYESGLKISRDATRVAVSNCIFDATGATFAGLFVQGANNVTLHGNIIIGDGFAALSLDEHDVSHRPTSINITGNLLVAASAWTCSIENSDIVQFSGNVCMGAQVKILDCTDLSVKDNYVSFLVSVSETTTAGIECTTVDTLSIENNVVMNTVIADAGRGIEASGCTNVIIAGNNVQLTTTDVAAIGIYAPSCTAAAIANNVIVAPKGIHTASHVTRLLISQNTIIAGYLGLYINAGSHARIIGNTISGALTASSMYNYTDDSLIVNNIITGDLAPVVFTGAGLNDLTANGLAFSFATTLNYVVEIDGTGTPDTFKWSDNGGSTWDATTVAITGSAQTLNNGVTVLFAATTGHTTGNKWAWTETGLNNNSLRTILSGNVMD